MGRGNRSSSTKVREAVGAHQDRPHILDGVFEDVRFDVNHRAPAAEGLRHNVGGHAG